MKYFWHIFIYLCISNGAFAQATQQPDTAANKKGTDSAVMTKVEIESEFPGGVTAWQQFLQQNLTYPDKAVRKNIQGTVVLQFIVGKDGTVTDMQALSGPEILREAALKAMQHTPKWKPAMQGGRLVKSYKRQPITFRF